MSSVKTFLLAVGSVLAALFVIGIGSALPPLLAFEQWLAPRRAGLAWTMGATAFAGLALLIGGAVFRVVTGGRPLTRQGIAEHVASVKDTQPRVARVARYTVPEQAAGASFSDAVTAAQFKDAWRKGLWRSDARWRGLMLMALGALAMAVGGFGLVIVLASPGVKLLAAGALVYAAVRTTWMLAKAKT